MADKIRDYFSFMEKAPKFIIVKLAVRKLTEHKKTRELKAEITL